MYDSSHSYACLDVLETEWHSQRNTRWEHFLQIWHCLIIKTEPHTLHFLKWRQACLDYEIQFDTFTLHKRCSMMPNSQKDHWPNWSFESWPNESYDITCMTLNTSWPSSIGDHSITECNTVAIKATKVANFPNARLNHSNQRYTALAWETWVMQMSSQYKLKFRLCPKKSIGGHTRKNFPAIPPFRVMAGWQLRQQTNRHKHSTTFTDNERSQRQSYM